MMIDERKTNNEKKREENMMVVSRKCDGRVRVYFLRLVPFLGYNACLPQSNPSLDFIDQIKVSFSHSLKKLLTRKREK